MRKNSQFFYAFPYIKYFSGKIEYFIVLNGWYVCHCEEQSDAAISLFKVGDYHEPNGSRNDILFLHFYVSCHCEEEFTPTRQSHIGKWEINPLRNDKKTILNFAF